MKLFDRAYLIRLDPKCPNIGLGDNLYQFTISKGQAEDWKENGFPMRRGRPVRVKRVFTMIRLCAWRKK